MNRLSKNIFVILICSLSACLSNHRLPSKKVYPITFDETSTNESLSFVYQDTINSPELKILLSHYKLDSVAQQGESEFEKMLHLMNWTNSRFKHDGANAASRQNTLTILKEAETGKKFRCVEYGVVLRSVLAATGFKARTLNLKTRDAEIVKMGGGHVLTEAWSNQFKKWIVLDPQLNIVPMLDDMPLNAVELQKAIFNKSDFKLIDVYGEVKGKRKRVYTNFVPHYLYYFTFRFDQREIPMDSLYRVNGNIAIMLVPNSAKNPTIFERKHKLVSTEYTNSINDFYKKPEEGPNR